MLTSNKVVAEVENLHIDFNLNIHKTNSLRDTFVSFVSAPFNFLFKPIEKLHVIKGISFKIKEGEKVGIIGINGVGKTSLCRALAGMYFPTHGKVKTYGNVRAIFDTSVGIMPELTGRENVFLISELMFPEIPLSKRVEFVEEVIEFSELQHFADTPFKNYSKGMQARLCLSLISAKESDLLILDEVFDGADQFFQEKIAKRVLSIIKDSGAVVFVSHSPHQIEIACNRLILLKDGKILFDGDIQEGLKVYNNEYK